MGKNSSNEYFNTISHYFCAYSLSRFIQAARLTDWSSSLLSLKFGSPFFRCKTFHAKDFQPLVQSGTVVFTARCYSPTFNKQRMNKMNPSRWTCCLETQSARWRHVEWRFQEFMACCQATADTKPIERFMTKAKSQFACDPRVIRVLRPR